MINYCESCQAVYASDYIMDDCPNLLCDGELMLMDEIVFNLIEMLKKKCCHLSLIETFDVIGSVYFYEIGFTFCEFGKSEELYEKMRVKIEEEKFKGKIQIDFFEEEDEPYMFTAGIADDFDDFHALNTFEKLDRIFALVMFLCEVCGGEDTEALSALMETKLTLRGEGTGEC